MKNKTGKQESSFLIFYFNRKTVLKHSVFLLSCCCFLFWRRTIVFKVEVSDRVGERSPEKTGALKTIVLWKNYRLLGSRFLPHSFGGKKPLRSAGSLKQWLGRLCGHFNSNQTFDDDYINLLKFYFTPL